MGSSAMTGPVGVVQTAVLPLALALAFRAALEGGVTACGGCGGLGPGALSCRDAHAAGRGFWSGCRCMRALQACSLSKGGQALEVHSFWRSWHPRAYRVVHCSVLLGESSGGSSRACEWQVDTATLPEPAQAW